MFQKTLAFRIFFTVSAILIGCFVFLPLLWLINTALKPSDQTFSLYLFFGPLTLDNIISIITDRTIMTYLKNSLIVSFLSSFFATLVSAFAGYSFSKFRYKGRNTAGDDYILVFVFPDVLTVCQNRVKSGIAERKTLIGFQSSPIEVILDACNRFALRIPAKNLLYDGGSYRVDL